MNSMASYQVLAVIGLLLPMCACNEAICGRGSYDTSGGDISPILPHGTFDWPNLECIYKFHSVDPLPIIIPYINLICGSDNITIYDGPDERSPELGTYCGIYRALRYPKWSSHDILTVVFRSSRFTRATGFHLIAGRSLIANSTDCSREYKSEGGMLLSPGYPAEYGSFKVCYYNIETSSIPLELTVWDFSLQNEHRNENIKGHCYDLLFVFGDECTSSDSTGQDFCGNSLSGRTICNQNGRLFLYFYTDETYNSYRGFNITWGNFSMYIDDNVVVPSSPYSDDIEMLDTTVTPAATKLNTSTKLPMYSIIICAALFVFVLMIVGVAIFVSEGRKKEKKNAIINNADATTTGNMGFTNPTIQDDTVVVYNNNNSQMDNDLNRIAIVNDVNHGYDQA